VSEKLKSPFPLDEPIEFEEVRPKGKEMYCVKVVSMIPELYLDGYYYPAGMISQLYSDKFTYAYLGNHRFTAKQLRTIADKLDVLNGDSYEQG
jgi:hypothetical protein